MTKVQSDISKIEQILQSENYEAGFELLRTKNDPALNESLSDLIQSTVRSKYFEDVSDQKEVDKGLEILTDLLPNLTSLDLSDCSMKNLDVSKFKNITTLNLSNCDSLENIDGLYELKSLSSPTLTSPPALDLKNSPLLTNLDVEKIKSLPNLDFEMDVVGLRDEIGLVGSQVNMDDWGDTLQEWLSDDFYDQIGMDKTGYFGKIILLRMYEPDFWDGKFSYLWSGKYIANWENSRGTPNEFKKAMKGYLNDAAIKEELKNAPSKDQVTVLLYNFSNQYLHSFTTHSEYFDIECQECYDTVPYSESVQVDPNDAWIRCCSDCNKKRNKE